MFNNYDDLTKYTAGDFEVIENCDNTIKSFAAMAALERAAMIDKFLGETLDKYAKPRILGRPTRFSLWWRRINLEVQGDIIRVKQGDKLLAQAKFNIKIINPI